MLPTRHVQYVQMTITVQVEQIVLRVQQTRPVRLGLMHGRIVRAMQDMAVMRQQVNA